MDAACVELHGVGLGVVYTFLDNGFVTIYGESGFFAGGIVERCDGEVAYRSVTFGVDGDGKFVGGTAIGITYEDILLACSHGFEYGHSIVTGSQVNVESANIIFTHVDHETALVWRGDVLSEERFEVNTIFAVIGKVDGPFTREAYERVVFYVDAACVELHGVGLAIIDGLCGFVAITGNNCLDVGGVVEQCDGEVAYSGITGSVDGNGKFVGGTAVGIAYEDILLACSHGFEYGHSIVTGSQVNVESANIIFTHVDHETALVWRGDVLSEERFEVNTIFAVIGKVDGPFTREAYERVVFYVDAACVELHGVGLAIIDGLCGFVAITGNNCLDVGGVVEQCDGEVAYSGITGSVDGNGKFVGGTAVGIAYEDILLACSHGFEYGHSIVTGSQVNVESANIIFTHVDHETALVWRGDVLSEERFEVNTIFAVIGKVDGPFARETDNRIVAYMDTRRIKFYGVRFAVIDRQ